MPRRDPEAPWQKHEIPAGELIEDIAVQSPTIPLPNRGDWVTGAEARERNCDPSIEKVFAMAEWMGFLSQRDKGKLFHELARRLLDCDEMLESWE
jgi:hypothetical protein